MTNTTRELAAGRAPASSWQFRLVLALMVLTCLTLFVLEGVAGQLCCADDGSFAVVSKNLANGLGYVFTLNYLGPDYAPHLFDPALGTGPVSIFSSALLIALLGAKAWVPGLSTALLSAIYLTLIGQQLRIALGERKALFSLGAFVSLVVALSAYDFHYWSAQLGEGIAALAVALGYLYWTNRAEKDSYALYAGVALSLAFLTKELSALYIAALAIYAAGEALIALTRRIRSTNSRRHLVLLGMGLTGPLAAFEIYRLWAFGSVHLYLRNWLDHISFVQSQGLSGDTSHGAADVGQRVLALADRHGLNIYLGVAALLVVFHGLIRGPDSRNRLVILIVAGILLHLVYWIWFSIGWPRYAFTAVVLFALMLSLHCGWSDWAERGALITVALAIAIGCGPKLHYLATEIRRGLPPPQGDIAQAQKLTKYMDAERITGPIYTGWWADVANLEYLSKTPASFSGYQAALSVPPERAFALVTNSRFPVDHEDFVRLVQSCRAVFTAEPYALYMCPPPGK